MQEPFTFGTAAALRTADVPVAGPSESFAKVREALTDRRYKSAGHLVVCQGGRFLGMATIEDVLAAPGSLGVDADGRFIGLIPPERLLAVLLAEHEEDLSRLGGFLKSTSDVRATSEEPPLATVIQDLLSIWIYLRVTTLVV